MPTHIKILAVGRRMPSWVNDGIADYRKRMRDIRLEILEIPQVKRTTSQPPTNAMQQECAKLLSATPTDAYLVALDQSGLPLSSEQLAAQLKQWMQNHQTAAFMIGGSDGLDNRCKKASRAMWSLSSMTLPHALARLMLVEQLYRAWTILKDHPYHRS